MPKTMKPLILIISIFSLVPALTLRGAPNFVFILADDMGYGDVAHAGGRI